MTNVGPSPTHHADDDGNFRRKPSSFRNFISKDPNSDFPAETGRYALYMNYGCPWAHRTSLVRLLKGLEDIVQLIPCDFELTDKGWLFTGKHGSMEKDPLYGFTNFQDLYRHADPNYQGRYTVPCLWDKMNHTIVNNESSEIIRMFYTAFDDLLPENQRDANAPGGGFYPEPLRAEIDAMNDWVYSTVNNGVYKTGFATTQKAYDANVYPLFESLDRLEAHLAPGNEANHGGPFLFGKYVTEADVRLFTTLIRFDVAYHTLFMCNRKLVRHDYPNLYHWLRLLYWRGGKQFSTPGHDRTNVFKDTTNFEAYKFGYADARGHMVDKSKNPGELIVPAGPVVDIDPLDDDEDGGLATKVQNLKVGDGIKEAVATAFASEGKNDTNGA